MKRTPLKPRLRLPPDAYRQLHRQVLQRDGWRCQVCGKMSNLEVHHKRFRSRAGTDSEQNLITLPGAMLLIRAQEAPVGSRP